MLALNGLLMAASTLLALDVLAAHVCLPAAAVSLVLNFVRRHHELSNMVLVVAVAALWSTDNAFGSGVVQ